MNMESVGHSEKLKELILLEDSCGYDVTELLGVTKYEPPLSTQLSGIARGNFPSFVSKTDQERVQNIDLFWIDDLTYQVTEKLDGSSMTVYYKDGVFGVCSRNLDLLEDYSNTFWKVAGLLNLQEKLENYGNNIAIQGELVGPGIQGNKYKLNEYRFYVFDTYNINEQRYFYNEFTDFICKLFDLLHVPVIGTFDRPTLLSMGRQGILDYADRASAINNNSIAEGVVFKSHTRSCSFKAISNRFLLKNGE